MFKQCFSCNRKFSFERFAQLLFHSVHEFGKNFLEIRKCPCGILISVEREIPRNEVVVVRQPYKDYTEFTGIAVRSNKGRRCM